MNDNNEQELPLGLYWKGKRTTVDRIVLPFQSLEVVETINESRATREKDKNSIFRQDPNAIDVEWRNKLIWGDNKYVMSALLEQYAGKIDLIYIDPPFATGANFSYKVKIGEEEVESIKESTAIEELAYRDTWGKGLDSYLQMMYDRLVIMRELLNDEGLIWVHVDDYAGHYIKVIMDEIFGLSNYFNEIVWYYPDNFQGNVNRYADNHNVIFVYGKTEKAKIERVRIPLDKPVMRDKRVWDKDLGKIVAARDKKGNIIYEEYTDKWADNVWTIGQSSVPKEKSKEHLGYPTQKPEELLKRVIESHPNKDAIVADFFCGSGTTAAVAEKLGRRWITSDLGRYAIHTARKRFLEIEGCKPFEILNIGKYERQYWQTIQFGNKTAEQTLAEYIGFVLKLYKAEALPGSAYIHGKKENKLVHIGGVDAPVTFGDIQHALEDTRRMKQKELVCLS